MSENSGDNSTTTSKIIDVSATDTQPTTSTYSSDNEIYYSGEEEQKQHYKLSFDLEIASPNKPQRASARTILRVKPTVQPASVINVEETDSTTDIRASRRKPVNRPIIRVADGTLQEISSKRINVQHNTYTAEEQEYRDQEFNTMQEEILSLILSNSQLKKENAQLIDAYRYVHRAKRRLEDEIIDIRSTLSQNEDDMTKLYNYIAFLEARVNKLNPKQPPPVVSTFTNVSTLPKKRGRPAARGGGRGGFGGRPPKKTRVDEQGQPEAESAEEESGNELSDSSNIGGGSEPDEEPQELMEEGGEEEEESAESESITSPIPTTKSSQTPGDNAPVIKRKVGRPRRAPSASATPPLVSSQRARSVYTKNKDGSESFLDNETDELDRRRTRFTKEYKDKGEKQSEKKDKKDKLKVQEEAKDSDKETRSDDSFEIMDVDLSWAAMIAHTLKTLGGMATHREIAERLRIIFPRVHHYKNLSNTISSVLSISGKFAKETIEPQEGTRVTYNWSLKPGEVILPIPKPKPSAGKALAKSK